MAKIIIATQKHTATAGAKKPKKVKEASNTQIGVMRGLHKDSSTLFNALEQSLDDLGVRIEEIENYVNEGTYSAAGVKPVAALLRNYIKTLKAATSAVEKVDKASSSLFNALDKAIHPDARKSEEDEEEADEE